MKITTHELSQLSISELTNLNQLVIATIKAQIANALRVKQEVKINHKSHENTIFIIEKINKSKAVCSVKGSPFKSYNVPLSMIITE